MLDLRPTSLSLALVLCPLLASPGFSTDGAPSEPVEVRVPADLGLDALPARADAQKADAASWSVRHDFSFEDRVDASGIEFRHDIVDDAGPHYKAVHYDHGNGVSAADVDGDGDIDLYFTTQMGRNELWLNDGEGRFEDGTDAADVALGDRISVAAAFGDIENDGDPDLFVTTVRHGNALFVNDGKGRFEDRTEAAGLAYSGHSSGPTFFDYDGDGLLDLFVTNVGTYTSDEQGRGDYWIGLPDAFKGHNYPEREEASILYRNLGDGRFENVSKEALLLDRSWSGDATPTDFDGDGDLDLYVLNMQGPDHYWENVDGRFFVDRTRRDFPVTPPGSMGVKVFDWNRDGRMDLFLTDMHSDMTEKIGPEREKLKARVPEGVSDAAIFGNAFFEAGETGFSERSDEIGVENYWPWGVSVDDLNADGWDDLFITSSMNYPFRYAINSLLLNEKGRTYRDAEFVVGVEPRAGELTLPWFELDCSAEGEASYDAQGWSAFGGGGDAETTEEVDSGHGAHETPDSSNGKHPDCEGQEGLVTVMAAKGTRGSVLLDLEGDGDLDIVTSEFNDRSQVLVSDLAQRGPIHWLALELEGTSSNRSGFGAVVTVRTGDLVQMEVHDGKSGYLSQSVLPLYFGLGGISTIDGVTVQWPSGVVQEIAGPLEANQTLRLTEPAAPAAD